MAMLTSLRLPSLLVVGLCFPLAVLNLWVFSALYRAFEGIFSVFILAGVIALILNVPVRFLQWRWRLKRSWAIAITFVLFVVVLMALLGVLVPLLFSRLADFGQALPDWIDASAARLQDLASAGTRIGVDLDANGIINGVALGMKRQLRAFLLGVPDFLAGSLGGFLSLFFLVVLTVFFLIYGGQLVRDCLRSWLPGESGLHVLGTLRRNFNSFIFNQMILAVVLACALTPTLVLLRAPFPILAGVSVGMMGFIPFGAIVGILAVSLLFLLKSFWLGIRVFAVLIVVDQVIENILPPRLLGKLTGLNPIVILFSVMVGATLAGFHGIITAVPIAATIKELVINRDDHPVLTSSEDPGPAALRRDADGARTLS